MRTTSARLHRGTASERWLPIVGAALVCGGGLLIISGFGRLVPPCLFRVATGLNCPGCGSGRMLEALAHFDLGTAFRMNALAFVALPLTAYGLLAEGLSAWAIAELPRPHLRAGWIWVIFVVVVAFWLLRNLPIWPLTLLAPY